MRIIKNVVEMTETARGWLAGGTVGYIAIMSSIHAGHRSLIQTAQNSCEICVVSLTANAWTLSVAGDGTPSTYNQVNELRQLQALGVDVIFVPQPEVLFTTPFSTFVTPLYPTGESLHRFHHPVAIRNFATAMVKLFHLVRPDVAFLGQKDAQQIAILRKVIYDLNIDVSLRVVPTVREHDGLAVSSRNARLSSAGRQAAVVIYRALLKAKSLIDGGERRAVVLEKAMTDMVKTEPQVTLDYATVCHADTLVRMQEAAPGSLLTLGVTIEQVPLVDNILWQPNGQWRL